MARPTLLAVLVLATLALAEIRTPDVRWSLDNDLLDSSGNGGPDLTSSSAAYSTTTPAAFGARSTHALSMSSGPVADASLALTAGEYAISLWFQTSGSGDLFKACTAACAAEDAVISIDGSGHLSATVNSETVTYATDVADGAYHHVLLQFASGSQNAQLFVDGVLRGTAPTASNVGITPVLVRLGDATFTGLLDEVAVLPEVVTEPEVEFIYGGLELVATCLTGVSLKHAEMRLDAATSENGPMSLVTVTTTAANEAGMYGLTWTGTVNDGSLYQVEPTNPFACSSTLVQPGDLIYGVDIAGGSRIFNVCWKRTLASAESFSHLDYTCGSCCGNTAKIALFGYDECPTAHTTGTPPPPSVVIDYNAVDFEPVFNVTVPYLSDGTFVVVGFHPFDTGDTPVMEATSSPCSSLNGITQPATIDEQFFLSAPTATFPNALNNVVFPPHDINEGVWSTEATECGQIKFHTQQSFQSLEDCTNRASEAGITNHVGPLRVEGTLHVTYVSTHTINSVADLSLITFEYPFALYVVESISNLASFSEKYNFETRVADLEIHDNTGLHLTLETRLLAPPGEFLALKNFTSTSIPRADVRRALETITADPISSSAGCTDPAQQPCVQRWSAVYAEGDVADFTDVDEFLNQHRGTYEFNWNVNSTDDTVYAVMTLDAAIGNEVVNVTVDNRASDIAFFNNPTDFALLSGPEISYFLPYDTIYVRHNVDLEDDGTFIFVLQEAFLCYSTFPDFTPVSCRPEATIPGVLPPENMWTLYDLERDPTGIEDTPDQTWNFVHYAADSGVFGTNRLLNGFSFLAEAIAQEDSLTFYFHLISKIEGLGGVEETREVMVGVSRDDIIGQLADPVVRGMTLEGLHTQDEVLDDDSNTTPVHHGSSTQPEGSNKGGVLYTDNKPVTWGAIAAMGLAGAGLAGAVVVGARRYRSTRRVKRIVRRKKRGYTHHQGEKLEVEMEATAKGVDV